MYCETRDVTFLPVLFLLGVHFYTIGQRARIGGLARAYFVVGKDVQRKHIIVVRCEVVLA